MNAEAFGGNIKDYKEKRNALPGCWGREGLSYLETVVERSGLRLASDYSVPVSDLIESVQTAVGTPQRTKGKGLGLPPSGHVVTVTGVTTETVDIVTVTYQEGWDWKGDVGNLMLNGKVVVFHRTAIYHCYCCKCCL